MKDTRISTIEWVKQWRSAQVAHKGIVENLEKHLETNQNETKTSNRNDPVNILCLDGGGSKGISHLAILEELSQIAGRDVLSSFDLVGGSSVGGVTALTCNACNGDLEEICKLGYKTSDEARERSFKKFRLWNLLTKGHLQNNKDTLADIFHEAVGNDPLYNPTAMKAFAVCTVRSKDGNSKAKAEQSGFEPFVLRTYDMYREAWDSSSEEERSSLMQVPGTNDVKLWEAMTATSAAPVLANRVDLTIDGQTSRFGDGAVICNSPVAIAVNEAKSIWPDRPLGVILSISLGDESETEMIQRSVAAAQRSNPELHFLRLQPPCLKKYSVAETSAKVLEQMKDDVRSYVRESSEIEKLLSELNKKSIKRSSIVKKTARRSRGSVFMGLKHKLSQKRCSVEEVNLKLDEIALSQYEGKFKKSS